jgi:hypothetical protein
MYWPLGVASVFAIPEYDEPSPNTNDPLISLSRSALGNLLATITTTELFIWHTQVFSSILNLGVLINRSWQPMAVIASVRRSPTSIEGYGANVRVLLHAGDNQKTDAIIHTSTGYLIIYSITMSNQPTDIRYKLDTSRSGTSNRRRSFAGSGEPETIVPYSIKYRRMIKVDSRLSW